MEADEIAVVREKLSDVLLYEGENNDTWSDISQLLTDATEELGVGEMIHGEGFSLYSAMSAIELMQPKMDVGCGPVQDVSSAPLSDSLSDAQVVRIMDELLACEATWFEAHTLPQTVFSCVYTQRLDEVPRTELAAFIQVLLASMSLVRTLVTTEKVNYEEDFVAYNFGFQLPILSEPTVGKVVKEASEGLSTRTAAVPGQDGPGIRKMILSRLKFIQIFHSLVTALAAAKGKRISDAEILVELAVSQLKTIEDSWSSYPDGIIPVIFNPTFNRRLLANTPPRTAPLLSRPAAFAVWAKMLDHMRMLTVLKNRVLPVLWRQFTDGGSSHYRDPESSHASSDVGDNGGGTPIYSFHSLVYGLREFSALHDPSIIIRSLLKRMLLPSTREPVLIFSDENAPLSRLILGDLGLTQEQASPLLRMQAEELVPAAAHILQSLLRNRGRQRRSLMLSLVEWDATVASFGLDVLAPSPIGEDESSKSTSPSGIASDGSASSSAEEVPAASREGTGPNRGTRAQSSGRDPKLGMLADKGPLQLVGHEVSCRLMMHHWLLGFECNLYQPREYAPVFFYIGYVLTTSANATAAICNSGLDNAQLHPCRYSIYSLDEAKLWLCRATFSLLEALELGQEWAYSWRRRKRRWMPARKEGDSELLVRGGETMANDVESTADEGDEEAVFESEAMWYQQRFGMMRRFATGPQYIDYLTSLRLMDLQRDALMTKAGPGSDEVDVRLADASVGFKGVRDALNRAMSTAQSVNWEPVMDEARSLTRVAVSNAVFVAQLQKVRATAAMDTSSGSRKAPAAVKLSLDVHRHFPVVSIADS